MNRKSHTERTSRARRKGAMLVLGIIALTVCMAFVALSVDVGVISLEKTRMQNAVDAAALAAAQEISATVQHAGQMGADPSTVNGKATAAARQMASHVAKLNETYVDPDRDVRFGRRLVEDDGSVSMVWDVPPFNVVKVTARRTNEEAGNPDSRLKLFFAGVNGDKETDLIASATAFIETRDLVVVMDYSGSMSDDSEFRSLGGPLSQTEIESNMREIYAMLEPTRLANMPFEPQWLKMTKTLIGPDTATVTFRRDNVLVESKLPITSVRVEYLGGGTDVINVNAKIATVTGNGEIIERVEIFPGLSAESSLLGDGSGSLKVVFEDTIPNVIEAFGMDKAPWPWPGGSWEDFVRHCRENGDVTKAGYLRKYGGACLVDYLLDRQERYTRCPDLYKTPHYPFHAAKNGCSLFLDYLQNLGFGDQVGLVTYATYSKVQTGLHDQYTPTEVDLGDDLITSDLAAIDTIQRHKQAGHFASMTYLGGGLDDARNLLTTHGRNGARPTILLMTDGQANVSPWGWSLSSSDPDWNWADHVDYDGDGTADFQSDNRHKQYAFWVARQAIDQGYTIHTMSVGAGADRDLMKAIAYAAGGEWVDVPGGSTVAQMEAQMLAAFAKIAAHVPPPRLMESP